MGREGEVGGEGREAEGSWNCLVLVEVVGWRSK